jgi:threonine dehydratase
VAARAAGEPTAVEYVPSWVDGSGSRGVLAEMWPRVAPLIDDALVATLAETAAAVRLIAERLRVIAEGAGALAAAAALAGRAGAGRIVTIVSGGNIDFATFTQILNGEVPA